MCVKICVKSAAHMGPKKKTQQKTPPACHVANEINSYSLKQEKINLLRAANDTLMPACLLTIMLKDFQRGNQEMRTGYPTQLLLMTCSEISGNYWRR